MSKIYQPPGSPFDPLYIDCLANALARRDLNFSTQSATPVPVVSILLVAGLFDTDGKRLTVEIEGLYARVTGSGVTFLVDFDGAPVFTLSNSLSLLSIGLLLQIRGFRRLGGGLALHGVSFAMNGATDDQSRVCQEFGLVSLVDFSLPHTLSVRANVGNVADTLTLRGLSAQVI